MCIPKEELLAVFDHDGKPTGESVPRSVAHSKGNLHGASHVLICKQENDHDHHDTHELEQMHHGLLRDTEHEAL